VSIEELCFVDGRPYHCIVSNGYDEGALEFAEALRTAALLHHWIPTLRLDPRAAGTNGAGANSGTRTGLNDVGYSGNFLVLTVTSGS